MSGFPAGPVGASGLHAEWYAANAAAGAVTAQRCECGVWRLPARFRCSSCHGDRWSFEALTAEAVVESWTVTRRPLHFAYADVVPYALVVASSAEGPRLLVHLRPSLDDDDAAIEIGERVTLAVDADGLPYGTRLTRNR